MKTKAEIYYSPIPYMEEIVGENERMGKNALIEEVKDILRVHYPDPELQGETLSSVATIMVVEDDNVVVIDDDVISEREARELGLL